MLYRLRADISEDSNGNKKIVYGVDVFECVRSVPAVFDTEKQILDFLELCNTGQPSAEHFDDIIYDTIIKGKATHS